MRRTIIFVSLFLLGSPAFGGTIIMHGGSGRDCYLETLLDSATPERNQQSLRICNQAVIDTGADGTDTYDYAAALVNRADVKLRLEDYAGGLTDSDRAIAMDSSLGSAHLNRGAALVGLKRFQEAMPSLDKAIALNANKLESAYFDRGLAKESLGDIRGAYHDYLMAVQINPNFQRATQELSRFKVTNTDS
jgi:tetratricopeptide (TPR) repeat protein